MLASKLISELKKKMKIAGDVPIRIWHIHPEAVDSSNGRYLNLKYVTFCHDETNNDEPIIELDY